MSGGQWGGPFGPGNLPPDLWVRDAAGNLVPYSHPQSLQSEPTHLRRARAGGAFAAVEGQIAFTFEPHRYAYPLDSTVVLTAGLSTKILDKPNGLRNYLMLRNLGTVDPIYIQFDQAASDQSTLALLPGTTYGEIIFYDSVVPQSDIWAYCASAQTLAFSYSTFTIPGWENF